MFTEQPVYKAGHIQRHTVILNESLVSVLWFWDYIMRAWECDSFLRKIIFLFLLLVRLPVKAGSRGKKWSVSLKFKWKLCQWHVTHHMPYIAKCNIFASHS